MRFWGRDLREPGSTALEVAGAVLIILGVGAWSRPAGAIVAGVFCLLFGFLLGRTTAG